MGMSIADKKDPPPRRMRAGKYHPMRMCWCRVMEACSKSLAAARGALPLSFGAPFGPGCFDSDHRLASLSGVLQAIPGYGDRSREASYEESDDCKCAKHGTSPFCDFVAGTELARERYRIVASRTEYEICLIRHKAGFVPSSVPAR
jgi:hypothetical protein